MKKNILLIMIESWDGRVIGCLGDPALKNATPNIDKMASQGVLFRQMYTTHPICCPARANMWSGMYTFHCESWNNHKGLEKGTKILKDVLVEEGYVLATDKKDKIGIGKHDYLSGGHSQQNRLTAWTGNANIELPSYLQPKPRIHKLLRKNVHSRDWIDIKRAKRFLRNRARLRNSTSNAEPFFLYLSLRAPHPSFRTSKYWMSRVDYDKVSIPPKDKEVHPTIRYQQISKAWKWGFDPESVRKTRAIYYAMVAEMDAMVGEVLEELNNLGLRDDTYVILTADHGENNMEHELFYKMNMYESSVKVPLIVTGPGVLKGRMMDNIVSLIDIYPTILDMAGIDASKAPNKLDGESLLPLLRGETAESRNWAFSMYTGTAANTSIYMLRKGKWKYIAYPGYPPQLFDLESDPDEIDNLAEKEPEIVKELDGALRDIVDYEEIHKKWLGYCKRAFLEWRKNVRNHPVALFEYGAHKKAAYYDDIMKNSYKGWSKEHEQQLEEWLESID